MKRAFLIADSGGTKTDWILCDALGNKSHFTTDSYHPININQEWIDSKKAFWKDYTSVYNLEVYFFGSGCAQQVNKDLLKKAFHSWGIHEVQIQSDIIAAAKASFGNADGLIGILGTGSVIAEIENSEVKIIHGGLGYVLGDEGSGYYFGKLLLQEYFHEKCSSETTTLIENSIGMRSEILSKVYASEGKKFVSNLSELFSRSYNDEINGLHKQNINLCFEMYLPKYKENKTIYFVGSYAFFNRSILKEILREMGWKLGGVIEKPIDALTEYVLKTTF